MSRLLEPKIVLSSVVAGNRWGLLFWLVRELGCAGTEVGPAVGTDFLDLYEWPGPWIHSFHGTLWTKQSMPWGLTLEGRLAAYLGPFEDNPAVQLARMRGVPIVIHADVIGQLHKTGQLGLLDGLAVEVENIYPGQPWQGLHEAVSTYDLLAARASVWPSICLDVEHLARDAQWNGRSAYMSEVWAKALTMLGGRAITKVHLCDWSPATGQGHLPFDQGSLPIAEIVRFVRDHLHYAALVIECRGSEWDVAKLMKLGLGEEQAETIARGSVEFIRRVWDS